MEGTQRPINMAASFSPLNHSVSEKMRDKKADSNNKISEIFSLFFIFKNLLPKVTNMSILKNFGIPLQALTAFPTHISFIASPPPEGLPFQSINQYSAHGER